MGPFGVGTFCSWDVLRRGTVCGLGPFGVGTFLAWDVFGLGRFVLGRFVGAPSYHYSKISVQHARSPTFLINNFTLALWMHATSLANNPRRFEG